MPIELAADGISLHRGGRTILQNVAMSAAAGQVVALTGPSGSGKTSLLTVLATVESADRGTVRYNGHPISPAQRAPFAGRVQIAHQSFGLLSLLTASENVEVALQGLPSRTRPRRAPLREKATAALEAVGLAARADHLVEELSGGEQQRVALARAIATDPELLLVDEPTAQLDAANRAQVAALLLRLAHQGTTVVIATHDSDLSEQCDVTLRLRDGRLI